MIFQWGVMLSWFKCEFGPQRPPVHALGWTAIALLTGPIAWWISIVLILSFEYAKYFLILYILWMYLDREACVNSGRRWGWMRKLPWWKWHRDYFPIKLVKTCDLPPDRNYLFALFPHGVFTYGAMTSFATDALHFDKTFPDLKMTVCTLNVIFRLPILREFALGQGFRSVSEKSLNRILQDSEKGRAAAVVVGGAAEAALSKPNHYRILLNKRKGFCKIALKNGCDLVPVYSFGESDLYELHEAGEGSLLCKIQLWVKKATTVFPVIFYGVGPFRLFPRRVPITVTVGKPIRVKKTESPNNEDIEQLHGKFVKSMIRLFNNYKENYLRRSDAELIIC